MDRPNGSWLESRRVGRWVFSALLVTCLALALADLLIERPAHFRAEGWPGFHAAFGFAATVFIIGASSLLRRLVRRDESYYGEEDRPGVEPDGEEDRPGVEPDGEDRDA